ncbi:MAG: hypothetical protein KJP17_02390 [Gammaproteobacteria bacterium]|nr:hypothetical protein [Gammaproteobacteria bacterium]
MRLISDIFERLPQVWVLLGLLFIATGLYLGFDYSLVFIYLGIGLVCFVYGVVLFFFLLREKPRRSNVSPLSRDFIQIGATTMMPTPVGDTTED